MVKEIEMPQVNVTEVLRSFTKFSPTFHKNHCHMCNQEFIQGQLIGLATLQDAYESYLICENCSVKAIVFGAKEIRF